MGRIRSNLFLSQEYDWGWLDGMDNRRSQGFRHEALQADCERLKAERS